MDIDVVIGEGKFRAEVWEPETPDWQYREPYPEEVYIEVNEWCIETFGYHARTAYHIFDFKSQKDLEWFLLRWS